MKTSSAKAKGRRLQQHVAERLLQSTNEWLNRDTDCLGNRLKELQPGDIKPTTMGESGRDIQLSPYAEEWIDFDIECKNTETASPWAWMKQAKENTKPGRIPLVVFTRNREGDVYAMIRFEDLLKMR